MGGCGAAWGQATERFKAQRIPGPKPYYSTNERCTVWFEPTEVWELRGADLTLSNVHRAAFGVIHPDRGVSIRRATPVTLPRAAQAPSGSSALGICVCRT
jgi:ATP-dependent DNA ligase